MKAIRIFIVENHPDTLLGLRTVLELLGYAITSATSIGAALELAATTEFDLLLSDISLPDGDGWDLMRRLKKRQPVRGIAMSGFGMNADMLRSREAGFSEHLIKPFTPEELDAAIERVMKQDRPIPRPSKKRAAGRAKRA